MADKSSTDLTFEKAMQEMEDIARKLEDPNAQLDTVVKLYERAMELKKFCENKLNSAKLTIETVNKG